MEVDGAPGVALEAGIEQARRILQRGALGESHLHHLLVRLAGADYSRVRPHRNSSPLPLLDHLRVRLLHDAPDLSEHLPPPIAQLLDPRVDQLGGRVSFCSFAALPFHAVGGWSIRIRLPDGSRAAKSRVPQGWSVGS